MTEWKAVISDDDKTSKPLPVHDFDGEWANIQADKDWVIDADTSMLKVAVFRAVNGREVWIVYYDVRLAVA